MENLIHFNFQDQKLKFKTSSKLFSQAKIDDGTKILLNSLRKNNEIDYSQILDLGCGYGPLGIFLKKSFLNSNVLCTDRDSLAIEFTRQNAELNGVEVDTKSSLGFEKISGNFSLIACNFPAKLEEKGLNYFLSESSKHLEKKGVLAIVVVKELKEEVEKIIKSNLEKIIVSFKQDAAGYSIYHLSFTKKLDDEDPFSIEEINFEIGRNIYSMLTTKALQEYDTPHFTTQLIISFLKKINYSEITIINPGQGYIPLGATHPKSLDKINLVSRDLLQLKISKENLDLNAVNSVEVINTDLFERKTGLLVWPLHEEDISEIVEKFEIYKNNCKNLLIGGRLNLLKRFIAKKKLKQKIVSQKGKYGLLDIEF